MKKLLEIYKSVKKEGAFLYLPLNSDHAHLPKALLSIFGPPKLVMKLLVTPEKSIAQTTGERVLEAIETQGFYLQLPKIDDDEMQAIAQLNTKLSRG